MIHLFKSLILKIEKLEQIFIQIDVTPLHFTCVPTNYRFSLMYTTYYIVSWKIETKQVFTFQVFNIIDKS